MAHSPLSRRDILASAVIAPVLAAAALPSAPVALAKCKTYGPELLPTMQTMFQQLGLANKVRNKTVTVKLNLTGNPALRFQGKPLGVTHYTHPATLGAMIHLLDQAGAKRIRLIESCWATAGPLEEYMLDSGWNVRQFKSLSKNLEFENTNAIGRYKSYAQLKVPNGGEIFSAFHFNRALEETDLLLSMAKLKNHDTCGITLSMKNCFGNTPASIYGDDAGVEQPNESPTKGRLDVCHFGKRNPSGIALAERDASSPRVPEHRMPRISVEVVAARPVDIAFVDGIETIQAGEGPWVKGIAHVKPGVLLMGSNMVTTDTVATAVMGYDPRAVKGIAPFQKCDNMLLIAEKFGLGTADLKQIEVIGESIISSRFAFPGATSI
jgi:uncharacterized protein (DUF362 family)